MLLFNTFYQTKLTLSMIMEMRIQYTSSISYLQVSYEGQLYRDYIFRLNQANLAPLPSHSFAPGDMVFLSLGDPGESSLQATVVDYSSKWLRIAMPGSASSGIQVR